MFATPAAVLGVWFRGVLALAIIAGGIWLIKEWYDHLPQTRSVVVLDDGTRVTTVSSPFARIGMWRPAANYPTAMLAGGTALLLLSVGGGWLNPRLLRRTGAAVPDMGAGQVQKLTRPDGTELHVAIYGAANLPTVILSHGWGNDHTAWTHWKHACGSRYRVIAWDLPGLGSSTRPANGDFSLEKMAGDLAAVIDASGASQVVLMGHSIGAMATLTLCRDRPELMKSRIVGLILVHTTYMNPLRTMSLSGVMMALQKPLIEPLLYLQIALSPLVWLWTWLSYFNGSIHWSSSRSGFAGTESRQKLDFMARFQPRASPAVLARGGLGMLKYDARAILDSISIPVLVVSADRDPVTLPEASRHIHASVPASQLAELAPAKHFGLIEHDAAFIAATTKFIDEISNRSRHTVAASGSSSK